VRIGASAGTDNELVVVSTDPLGKRCVVRCSACSRTFVVAASAAVSAQCVCRPPTADRLAELRSEQHDLDLTTRGAGMAAWTLTAAPLAEHPACDRVETTWREASDERRADQAGRC
jgi:hypothetical protein